MSDSRLMSFSMLGSDRRFSRSLSLCSFNVTERVFQSQLENTPGFCAMKRPGGFRPLLWRQASRPAVR